MASDSLTLADFAEATIDGWRERELDPLTLKEIIRIQLQDIQSLPSRAGDEHQPHGTDDVQSALQAYVDDLTISNAVLSDRIVAADVATALLKEIPGIEEASRRDRSKRETELAAKLAGRRARDSTRKSLMLHAQRSDSDALKELWPMLLDADDSDIPLIVDPSRWAALRPVQDPSLAVRDRPCDVHVDRCAELQAYHSPKETKRCTSDPPLQRPTKPSIASTVPSRYTSIEGEKAGAKAKDDHTQSRRNMISPAKRKKLSWRPQCTIL